MHSFLWSGKDGEGKRRAERVEAEGASEAKAILISGGWTELQLITGEIHDAVKQSRFVVSDYEQPETTPEQEVAVLQPKSRLSKFLRKWSASIWEEKGAIVLMLIILGAGIFIPNGPATSRAALIFIGAGGLLVLIFLHPILLIYFSRTSRAFRRLNDAKVHGRWEEVLECVESLRRSHQATRIGLSEVELVRNRALALARLGRFEEGLAEFQAAAEPSNTPRWLYRALLAGIYDAGKRHEEALNLRLQVAEEKPEMIAVWVDITLSLGRRLNRPAEAREALARAEALEQTVMAGAYIPFAKGVIYWREGKPVEAKKFLELALEKFRPLAGKPLVPGTILLVKSCLCVVVGQLGDTVEANRLFKEVESYLKAHQEEELLESCRKGL